MCSMHSHNFFLDSKSSFSPPTHCDINSLGIILTPVTTKDIISACKKLKNKFTSGVDNIPAFIIKDCATIFAEPLSHLFNTCIESGKYPDLWKIARVTPVYKKGEATDVSNYRPISILCNFSKVFEIILHNKIYSQIRTSISTQQHGFVKGRSTLTNLVLFSLVIF